MSQGDVLKFEHYFTQHAFSSKTIQISLRSLSDSLHTDITWLRISLKSANGSLEVVQNVRMTLNINYPLKLVN